MAKSTTGSANWLFLACKARTGDPMAKLVLITLADRADDAGRCWPSISTVAKECECSRRTVERALSKLEAMGFIERIQRTKDGLKLTSVYRLTLHATQRRIEEEKAAQNDQIAEIPHASQSRIDTSESRIYGCTENRASPATTDASESRIDASESRRGSVTESHKTPIETPNKDIKRSTPKPEPEVYVRFANFMWERIQAITDSQRQPNLEAWAKSIRLLVERDGRDLKTASKVFVWANQDRFWASNIQSASKFREQFDKLYPRWRDSCEINDRPDGPGAKPGRLSPSQRVGARRRGSQ